MTGRLTALVVVIAAFGLLSTVAMLDVGYWGILKPHFESWGAGQVLADLVILAVLSCIWMIRDARARGLIVWPYLAVTLVAGSFGPLLYLVVRELRLPKQAIPPKGL